MQRNENSFAYDALYPKWEESYSAGLRCQNTKYQKIPLEQEIKASIKIVVFNEISLLSSTDSKGYTSTLITSLIS